MATKRSKKATSASRQRSGRATSASRQRSGRALGPPEGERTAGRNGMPTAVHRAGRAVERAGRAAVERAGRGRNPVVRGRSPVVRGRNPVVPGRSSAAGWTNGRRGNGQAPPLTVRGVGLLAGGLLLGVGAGVTLERALIGRDRRRDDPEAGEPFGAIRGTPAKLTSHDGTRLHVEELGQGPCIVFSHGFSLTQDAWHYQRRDLPDRFRCVFFDQRGHGRSGRSRKHDYSLQALAGDLKAVLDWTGEERVVVVAHSMGGIASLQFAEMFPEEMGSRVAGLVLVGSTYVDIVRGMTAAVSAWGAAWAQRTLITGAFRFMGQDPVRANQLRRRGSDLGYLGTRLFGFGSNPSPSQVAFIDRTLAGVDVEVWAKVYPSLIDFDLSESLEAVNVPALVVVGDKDRLTPPAAARYMADKIPGSRLLILEDAGHCAFLEEHEFLTPEIAAFATEVLDPRRAAARRRRRTSVRRVRGS
jgi:pimeloyl-ACP methyl ester carboxylesterase